MNHNIISTRIIVVLFFLSTIISCSSQNEALEECDKLSNHINSKVLAEINDNIKDRYGSNDVLLTRTYCDTNSEGNDRFNYSYDVKNQNSITPNSDKYLIDAFCSNPELQILFDVVKEVKYHYLTRNGKKLKEIVIFKNTCK